MRQVFRVLPGRPATTQFFLPELQLSLEPLPDCARLFGPNSRHYQVSQVRRYLDFTSNKKISPTGGGALRVLQKSNFLRYREKASYC